MSDRSPNSSTTPPSEACEPEIRPAAEELEVVENSIARTENAILCNFPGLRELAESGEG